MELKGKRILILAEHLYQEMELWYPKYRFLEAGAEVVVVGNGEKVYKSKLGYEAPVDKNADEVNASEFDAVIDARSRAQGASGPEAAASAERALAEGVDRILALAEAYPDLKAGQSFLDLQRSLVEIEDHVQEARRYYNAVVRDLNTRIEQFPSNLIAGLLGFEREEPFGLSDPGEAAVPEVRP